MNLFLFKRKFTNYPHHDYGKVLLDSDENVQTFSLYM